MTIGHRLAAIACAVLATGLALPAAAAEKDSGLYFRVGVGPNFAQDPGMKISGTKIDADLDPGIRVSAAVGYDFNKYLSAEFETGILWSTFDHFRGGLGHVPYLVDGLFRYPIGGVEPYVGAGIGGSADVLYVHDFGLNDTDVDVNFAWQALAGVRFEIQKNMYFGVGYKYFGTTGSGYNIDGEHTHLGASHNHTMDFSFKMRF